MDSVRSGTGQATSRQVVERVCFLGTSSRRMSGLAGWPNSPLIYFRIRVHSRRSGGWLVSSPPGHDRPFYHVSAAHILGEMFAEEGGGSLVSQVGCLWHMAWSAGTGEGMPDIRIAVDRRQGIAPQRGGQLGSCLRWRVGV